MAGTRRSRGEKPRPGWLQGSSLASHCFALGHSFLGPPLPTSPLRWKTEAQREKGQVLKVTGDWWQSQAELFPGWGALTAPSPWLGPSIDPSLNSSFLPIWNHSSWGRAASRSLGPRTVAAPQGHQRNEPRVRGWGSGSQPHTQGWPAEHTRDLNKAGPDSSWGVHRGTRQE